MYEWACKSPLIHGPIAQLGESSVRIREVDGSNPFGSTTAVGQRKPVCSVEQTGFLSDRVRILCTSAPSSGGVLKTQLCFRNKVELDSKSLGERSALSAQQGNEPQKPDNGVNDAQERQHHG